MLDSLVGSKWQKDHPVPQLFRFTRFGNQMKVERTTTNWFGVQFDWTPDWV